MRQLKLSPHYLPGGEDETRAWLALRPTSVKFCYAFELALEARPGTLCIGRPDESFIGNHPLLSGDPVKLAEQMAREVYAPLIATYPSIHAWEGPNEINCNSDQVAEMRWYSAFLAELGRQVQLLGRRAVLGAWAPGTPDFSMWQYYTPVLQACSDYGAILSRHSYGPLDQWYSYRHRLDEIEFAKLGFHNTPVVISESGPDALGGMAGRWLTLFDGDLQRFWLEYLRPFELELQKDSYVLGTNLFTVGTGFAQAWREFDVASHPDKPGLPAIIASDTVIQDAASTLTERLAPPPAAPAAPVIKETTMPPSVSQVVIVPLNDQQTDHNSAIISMVGQIPDQAELVQCLVNFYHYLKTHGGSPIGFGYKPAERPSKPTWWAPLGLKFTCLSNPLRGQLVHYYHAPTDSAPFRPSVKVTWPIDVVDVVENDAGAWLKCGPGLWLMACDCSPQPNA